MAVVYTSKSSKEGTRRVDTSHGHVLVLRWVIAILTNQAPLPSLSLALEGREERQGLDLRRWVIVRSVGSPKWPVVVSICTVVDRSWSKWDQAANGRSVVRQ